VSIVSVSSLSNDISTSLPAAGSPRRSEHFGHNIWQEEQNPSVLFVMAQDKNTQN